MPVIAGSMGEATSPEEAPRAAEDRETWAELWRSGAVAIVVLSLTASVAALILACL